MVIVGCVYSTGYDRLVSWLQVESGSSGNREGFHDFSSESRGLNAPQAWPNPPIGAGALKPQHPWLYLSSFQSVRVPEATHNPEP